MGLFVLQIKTRDSPDQLMDVVILVTDMNNETLCS